MTKVTCARVQVLDNRIGTQEFAGAGGRLDYKRFLGDNKTMLLLSTHRDLFDTLFTPPNPGSPVPPRPPAPVIPTTKGDG